MKLLPSDLTILAWQLRHDSATSSVIPLLHPAWGRNKVQLLLEQPVLLQAILLSMKRLNPQIGAAMNKKRIMMLMMKRITMRMMMMKTEEDNGEEEDYED